MCFADDIVILLYNLGEANDILQELNDAVQEMGPNQKTKMMTNMVTSDEIKNNNNNCVYLGHEIKITRDLRIK